MIDTVEEAAEAAVEYCIRGFDTVALHVVDLGAFWRVFVGSRTRDADGRFVSAHSRFCPSPLVVDRSTGAVSMEHVPLVEGPSAQIAYRAMLKNDVAPELRKLGLRGSGSAYRLTVPGHHVLVGLPASRASTWACARIRGRVGVLPHAVWEQRRAEHGGAGTPSIMHFGLDRSRSFGEDWHVYAGVPTGKTGEDIVAAVRDEALPLIHGVLRGGDQHGDRA